MKKPSTVAEYIAGFPASTQKQLEEIRAIIRKAAPGAEEVISYGMPGYRLHSVLVWFGGYEKHIGFYPSNTGIEAFKDALGGYTFSKGAVQFPLGKPLPKKLITEIVKFRMLFDQEIAAVKQAAKAAKKMAAQEAKAVVAKAGKKAAPAAKKAAAQSKKPSTPAKKAAKKVPAKTASAKAATAKNAKTLKAKGR
jgi:uncharacterized protein YdhG (YjbR/CyaY superfamily)